MKTPRNKAQGLHLKKSNNRWKWMAGATAATAATAAGVTASQANTITVNLLNNYISDLGNHLNADLTGDGHPDLTITNAAYSVFNFYRSDVFTRTAMANLNGVRARAVHSHHPVQYVTLGSQFKGCSGGCSVSLMGSIPITFKDLHINGGALTSGSLEVTALARNDRALITLDSFTYNTPDQGSSLALLALGSGGIVALRLWRSAQGRS